MNWKKAISFGLLFWIVMFVIVSIFVALKIYDFVWMKVIAAIIAGVVSFILAGYVKPNKVAVALSYGLVWVVVGLILDYLVTTKFSPEIFSSWDLWLGYLLVLLAPLLKVKKVQPV